MASVHQTLREVKSLLEDLLKAHQIGPYRDLPPPEWYHPLS